MTLTPITPRRLGPNQIDYIENNFGHTFFRQGLKKSERVPDACLLTDKPKGNA